MSLVQDNLKKSNEAYASKFTQGSLPLPPAKHYAVLTCMDARIDPIAAFGIKLGDAHVIRNAGGNVVDALRSLVISEQLLGTNEILLIKHTDCGMLTFKNDEALGIVEKSLEKEGVEETKKAFQGDFQAFAELEQAVRDDVKLLKSSALIPKGVTVSGWVYDVKTGKVAPVV